MLKAFAYLNFLHTFAKQIIIEIIPCTTCTLRFPCSFAPAKEILTYKVSIVRLS